MSGAIGSNSRAATAITASSSTTRRPSVIDRDGASRPLSAEGIARDGKGWMFELWDADGQVIREEAAKRGISLQFGGHHLPGLLKRELFETHPDWFPLRNGVRDARYNLCTSNPGAIAEVRARAREFFERFSGAAVYHLWADDIVGGGWCSCGECASLTPSDQALRATNVLAEVLAEVDPKAVVAHLAYHDTIAPPTSVTPAANVTALYAPRNRNYAFPIDDPSCVRNAEGHYAELIGLGQTFRDTPNALACFEYYSDAILYRWLDPPNLGVLPRDAQAYSRRRSLRLRRPCGHSTAMGRANLARVVVRALRLERRGRFPSRTRTFQPCGIWRRLGEIRRPLSGAG